MATPKTDRNQYGDFEFDSDLNFDFDTSDTEAERPKRDRRPVDHIVEGVKSGLKTKFTDPSTYTHMVRDALPEGLGKAWESSADLVTDTSRLYDETISQVKPQLSSIMRKIDSLVPDNFTRVKKFTSDIAKAHSSKYGRSGYDEEGAVDEAVKRAMTETFGQYAEQNEADKAETDAQRIVDNKIDQDRFETSFKVQEQTASAVTAIRDYTTTFNLNYQKRSLELQYRSYFAQSALLKSFNEFRKIDEALGRATVKNTGLPEYAKVKESERFAQVAKDRVFGAVHENLFGTTDRIKNAADRFKKAIKTQMDEFKENLSLADDVLESVVTQKEMAEMQAEMEGREYSGYHTVGASAGAAAGSFVSSKVSKQLKKLLEKNPTVMKAALTTGRFANNPGAIASMVRGSEKFNNSIFAGGARQTAAEVLDEIMTFMGDQGPDLKVANARIGEKDEDVQYSAKRIARAQADVIPGYLARILREVQVLRTGKEDTPLTVFDPSTGKFRAETQMASDIISSIRKSAMDGGGYKDKLNSMYDEFSGGETFEGNESDEVKDFLGKLSRKRNFDYTGPEILKTREFKELSPQVQERVKGILKTRYSGDELESIQNKYKLTSRAMETRNEIKDHRSVLSKAIADGLGPELEKQGIIAQDEDGSYKLNSDGYYKQVDEAGKDKSPSIFATSDMTKKENISLYNQGNRTKSLDGILNTPNYTWNYRASAKMDQGAHLGPMAQDVQRNLGNETAPGGKEIDLISMNGHMLSAIQELNKRIDGSISEQGNSYLKSIDENVKAIASRSGTGGGESMASTGNNRFQFQGSGVMGQLLSALLNAGSEGFSKLTGAASKTGSFLKDQVAEPGMRGAKKFYDDNKDGAKSGMQTLWRAAINATNSAVRFGSDVLFNQAPQAVAQAKQWVKGAITAGVKLFNDAKDVYIPGTVSPMLKARLMEMGVYRDQATGKVIKSLEDLASISGNIIDHTGKVILSIEDMANGIFTSDGKPVRTMAAKAMAWAKDKLSTGLSLGRGIAGGLMDKARGLAGIGKDKLASFGKYGKDKLSGIGGSAKEIAQELKNYIPSLTIGGGNCECWTKPALILEQIRDILAMGKGGKRLKSILSRTESHKDMKEDETTPTDMPFAPPGSGTEDTGQEIQGPTQATSPALGGSGKSGSLGSLFSGLGGAASAGKGLLGKLAGKMTAKSGKGGFFGKLNGLLGKGMSKGAGLLGGLGAMLSGGKKEEPSADGAKDEPQEERQDSKGMIGRLLAKGRTRALDAYRRATGKFNDRNGDGQRDGGSLDQMKNAEDRRQINEQRKNQAVADSQAGLEKNRYAGGDALGTIFSMAKGLLGVVGSMAGGIMSGAAGLLGFGGKAFGAVKGIASMGGALGRGALAAGSGLLGLGKGLFNAGGFAAGAARTLGTPLAAGASAAGGLLTKIPGVATVARYGSIAARAAMAVGMAAGGTSGLVIGALGAAASSIGAALTSPLLLGAAAVAGVGYGGYKLYKYVTRNDIDEWQRIRVIQYGLSGTTATEVYNSQVMGLENYFLDGRIGYQGKLPYINERTVEAKDILDIFSIDPENKEMVNRLSEWLEQRFKPVFLHHIAALARVNMKVKLSDLDKLKPDEKLEYLSKAAFESGPYNVTVSPFKGLDVLNTNAQPAFDLVNSKIKTVGKDIQHQVKKDLKAGQDQPKGDDAKNANVSIASAANNKANIPNIPESAQQKANASQDTPQAKPFSSESQEDGNDAKSKNSTIMGPSADNDQGMTSTPKTAKGALSDGSAGMKYIKLGKDAVLEGMHPSLMKQFLAMAQEYGEATGKTLNVNEAFRSYQRQDELYRANPKKAAKPGNSMHEHGLAMDISTTQVDELEQLGLMRKYGFTRPVGGETWHIEPAGLQGSENLAKKDKSYADLAIQSSVGRGGGGQGSIKGTKLGSRNPKMAMEIYNAGTEAAPEKKAEIGAPDGETAGLKPPQLVGDGKVAPGASMATAGTERSVDFKKSSMGMDIMTKPMQSTGSSSPAGDSSTSGTGDGGSGSKPQAGGDGGGVRDQIASAAKEAGVNPNDMLLMSAMESSLNPKASTGKAKGLNQFMDGTWNESLKKYGSKYGLTPSSDPFGIRPNTLMGSEYYKNNLQGLSSVRPNPSFTDGYMAHYLGLSGAKKFFSADPNTEAASLFQKAAADPINANLFYENNRPLTTSEMYSKIEKKIANKAKAFNIPYSPTGLKGPAAAYSDSTVSLTDSKKAPAATSVAEFNVPTSVTKRQGTSDEPTASAEPRAKSTEPTYVPQMRRQSANQNVSASSANTGSTEVSLELVKVSREQASSLSSIDTAILKQVVPILRSIDDKIGNMSQQPAAKQTPMKEAGNTSRSDPTPSPFSKATPSSFDNRRVLS